MRLKYYLDTDDCQHLTLDELTKKINFWIRKELGLYKLIPQAQQLFKNGTITLGNIVLLAQFKAEEQKLYINRAVAYKYADFKKCIEERQ